MKNKTTILALAVLAIAGSAQALPFLTGSVAFSPEGENTQPQTAAGANTTWGLADRIDFGANGYVAGGSAGVIQVDSSDGDFPVANTLGTINDFQFDPLSPSPVNPLWTIGGFQFSLETVSIVFQNPAINALLLSGTGTVTAPGFDPTPGAWTFSASSVTGTTFSFSSTTDAVGVPDGGTTAGLLGAALLGLGMLARRKA